jgi:hypothetical protein
LLALLLVEVALRVVPLTSDKSLVRYDRRPGDEGQSPRPNQSARTLLGVVETTNSHGLRDPERPLPRPPDPALRRIAMVGDSMVWGYGVPGVHAPSRLMERELARRAPERTWEVWSLAQPASNVLNHAARYERLGRGIEPDLTVVVVLYNDLLDGPTRFRVTESGYLARRGRRAPYPDAIRPVLDRSVLFHALMVAWYAREQRHDSWGEAFDEASLPGQLDGLGRILAAVREDGGRFLLVSMPGQYEPPGAYPWLRDRLGAWAAARGVPFTDLGGELGVPVRGGLSFRNDSTHLNEEGNLVVADRLAAEVLALVP